MATEPWIINSIDLCCRDPSLLSSLHPGINKFYSAPPSVPSASCSPIPLYKLMTSIITTCTISLLNHLCGYKWSLDYCAYYMVDVESPSTKIHRCFFALINLIGIWLYGRRGRRKGGRRFNFFYFKSTLLNLEGCNIRVGHVNGHGRRPYCDSRAPAAWRRCVIAP